MKMSSKESVLQYGARKVPYHVTYSESKRLRIVVAPDLEVRVFAPKGVNENRVHSLVHKKAGWICQKLDKLEIFHPLPSPKEYISGETYVYLGRQYRLKVIREKVKPAKLSGRFLWVRVNQKKDAEKAVKNWTRIKAKDVFDRYFEKCYAIATRHGVPEPTLVIRDMRKRWGSCSVAGRITLNLKLIQVPVHCIEYVIMHELCHLKYHNHSKAFYSLLTRCQPDWRKRREVLDNMRIS